MKHASPQPKLKSRQNANPIKTFYINISHFYPSHLNGSIADVLDAVEFGQRVNHFLPLCAHWHVSHFDLVWIKTDKVFLCLFMFFLSNTQSDLFFSLAILRHLTWFKDFKTTENIKEFHHLIGTPKRGNKSRAREHIILIKYYLSDRLITLNLSGQACLNKWHWPATV